MLGFFLPCKLLLLLQHGGVKELHQPVGISRRALLTAQSWGTHRGDVLWEGGREL